MQSEDLLPAPQQLAPVPQPIAIFDQFVSGKTEVLAIREKVFSLTGDSFDVKLADDETIFKVKAKLPSISGRKAVNDTSGNHLFDLVKEHFHLHPTFATVSPDGKELLKVKSGISCKFLFPLSCFLVLLYHGRNSETISHRFQSHRYLYLPHHTDRTCPDDEGWLVRQQGRYCRHFH